MFRYIGIALLTAVSAYTGHVFADGYRKKAESLGLALKLIEFIRSRIEFFNEPLDEICESFARAEGRDTDGPGAAPETSPARMLGELCPGKEGERLLRGFSAEIGRGSREEQLRLCGYYAEALGALYEKEREELPKNIKLCCSLGLAAGLFAAVILI